MDASRPGRYSTQVSDERGAGPPEPQERNEGTGVTETSLPAAALQESLSNVLNVSAAGLRVRHVQDISPGLGWSRVFRVETALAGEDRTQPFILKVPDWGEQSSVQ